MSLVIATEVREQFGIAKEIDDERLEFCLRQASQQLQAWVTPTVYETSRRTPAENPLRSERLKTAESYLTLYYLLLNSAGRLRPFGVVKREQDAGGPMGGTVVNEYLAPAELKALRQEFWDTAQEAAAPYRPQASTRRAGTMTLAGGWRRSCRYPACTGGEARELCGYWQAGNC